MEKSSVAFNAGADLRVAEQSLASFQYSARRSEAMGEFGGKVTQIDIGQARQRVLTAESNLVTCQANLRSAKDRLKMALAIPLDTEIALDSADLEQLLEKPLPAPWLTLDEAVELSKKYDEENAYTFVNGVLNRVMQSEEVRAKRPADEG
jgi:outer membrane protein TolC